MYDDKDDCPRGFHFCDKKQECVPDRGDVRDRLTQRYERYFFKEDKQMEKCKDGYKWCPKMEKCMPPEHFEKMKKEKMSEADELLDLAFTEGFEIFGKAIKAEKTVDRILDAIKEKDEYTVDMSTGRPYDHPKTAKVKVDVDECDMVGDDENTEFDGEFDEGPAREEDPQKKANKINHVPDQNARGLVGSIRKQLGEFNNLSESAKKAYVDYFKSMLAKWNIKSVKELPDDKKKEFFNAVDKGWKATHENLDLNEASKWMDPETARQLNTPQMRIKRLKDKMSRCNKARDPQKCFKYHKALIAKLQAQKEEEDFIDSYGDSVSEVIPMAAYAGGAAAIGAATAVGKKLIDMRGKAKTIQQVCAKYKGTPKYAECVKRTKDRMKAYMQRKKK
jgi:hypothetical protein